MPFMRRSFKQFLGSVLLVLIVFAGTYLFRHVFRSDSESIRSFEIADIAPSKPQDYILLGRKIDINSATAEIFETLPGIGPNVAEEIVRYRGSHGPFTSVEDLDNVKGVGPKTLEKIRPLVSRKK